MKKRTLKFGLVALLLLLMLGLTYTSFAYWDELTKEDELSVVIGEGKTLVVSNDKVVPAGKTLIPVGKIKGVNDIDSVELEYTVSLNAASITDLNLNVIASEILIGDSDLYSSLVNVDISNPGSIVAGKTATVLVTVTLNEPTNQTEYDAIINKTISFKLAFTAAQ